MSEELESEEKPVKSKIQVLREEISKSCPNLPSYKILEMCEQYGLEFNFPDVNTYRLFMILAAAESKILQLTDKEE